VSHGFVTEDEIASGAAAPGAVPATPALTPEQALSVGRRIPSADEPGVKPRFAIRERVRTLNLHPTGHTRLPRYARGKVGTIERDHGVYSFPDTVAHGIGDKRQHVYSVRFSARELWGDAASARDSVHLDMWDDYLERA
jgi:nitrile hydratase